MKFPILSLAILLASLSAAAQNLPDKPEPRFSKSIFIAGVSFLGAATTADGIATSKMLDRGAFENNPLLGRYPSPGRIAGSNALAFAGQVALFDFTEHNHRAWVRWAGRAYIAAAIVNHARLAACDSSLNVHSPTKKVCSGPYF